MSTAYNIYRFVKPNKQELSNIDYFEPFDYFSVYDADGEQTNEYIRLFRLDDEAAANKMYRGLGFDEKAISEKRVHLRSSDGYTVSYTDGNQIIITNYDDLQCYQITVPRECVAIKMECLWNSEDEYCYLDKKRVYEYIPALKEYRYAPINNSVLAKAEIPFLIFERYKGKCFIEKL